MNLVTPEEFSKLTDPNLLTLIKYIVKGGNGQVQYGAGSYLLNKIIEQLPKSEWSWHIVTLGFDNITHQCREVLCKYAVKQCTPTKETFLYLKERGFITSDGKLPKTVLKRCCWYMKYIWNTPLIYDF